MSWTLHHSTSEPQLVIGSRVCDLHLNLALKEERAFPHLGHVFRFLLNLDIDIVRIFVDVIGSVTPIYLPCFISSEGRAA